MPHGVVAGTNRNPEQTPGPGLQMGGGLEGLSRWFLRRLTALARVRHNALRMDSENREAKVHDCSRLFSFSHGSPGRTPGDRPEVPAQSSSTVWEATADGEEAPMPESWEPTRV